MFLSNDASIKFLGFQFLRFWVPKQSIKLLGFINLTLRSSKIRLGTIQT